MNRFLVILLIAAGALAAQEPQRPAIRSGVELVVVGGGAYLRIETGAGERGFERVLRENSAYYLLGVAPRSSSPPAACDDHLSCADPRLWSG